MLEKADIDAIVNAVKSGGPIPGGPEVEGDVKKDLALIQESIEPEFAKVSEALVILADAVVELKERLDGIEQEFGGFTGGLTSIIDKRNRAQFTGMLREKFPDFGRFEQIVKDLADVDLYEDLGNDLYEYKQSPEYSDEGLAGKAKEMLDQLSGKFGPILDALDAKKGASELKEKAGGKPVTAVEVEVKKGAVDPSLQKTLESMKGRR